MSRQELADAVNAYLWDHYRMKRALDETDIGRLERGVTRWPGRLRREALRAVLRVQADAQIGLYISRSSAATCGITPSEDTAPSSILPAWEAATSAAVRPDRPVDGDWNSFSVVTSMLAQQRQAIAPSALLSLVEAHRDCLLTLLRKAGQDAVVADIGAMLGEASIVASRLWSAQGNHATALAHCAYARRLADRFGDNKLGATARIFESNLHSGASALINADGDIMVGLRLLDEAATLSDHLEKPAHARIAAEQAQAFAALGMRDETKAALDRAWRAASEIADHERHGLFSDWNPVRLVVYEGTCRLLLRESTAAIEHLERAVSGLADDSENTNVALAARVDLAGAYAFAGHLEEGCTQLADVYDQLEKIGNLRGISRAERVRASLSRWNAERAVRELDDRMSAV